MPGADTGWSGHYVRRARSYIANRLPLPCALGCGDMVDGSEAWVVEHIVPRWRCIAEGIADLQYVPSNWGASHRRCSEQTGNKEKAAKAEALGRHKEAAPTDRHKDGSSKRTPGYPAKPVNLGPRFGGAVSSEAPPGQPRAPSGQKSPHLELEKAIPATDWAGVIGDLPWMSEFLVIPDDAHAPRFMTGRHPRAVSSLGPEFCEWADKQKGLHPRRTEGLRWWQRMVAYRILEVDEKVARWARAACGRP